MNDILTYLKIQYHATDQFKNLMKNTNTNMNGIVINDILTYLPKIKNTVSGWRFRLKM